MPHYLIGTPESKKIDMAINEIMRLVFNGSETKVCRSRQRKRLKELAKSELESYMKKLEDFRIQVLADLGILWRLENTSAGL